MLEVLNNKAIFIFVEPVELKSTIHGVTYTGKKHEENNTCRFISCCSKPYLGLCHFGS